MSDSSPTDPIQTTEEDAPSPAIPADSADQVSTPSVEQPQVAEENAESQAEEAQAETEGEEHQQQPPLQTDETEQMHEGSVEHSEETEGHDHHEHHDHSHHEHQGEDHHDHAHHEHEDHEHHEHHEHLEHHAHDGHEHSEEYADSPVHPQDPHAVPSPSHALVASGLSQGSMDKLLLKKGDLVRKQEKKDGSKRSTTRNWIRFHVELLDNVLHFYAGEAQEDDDDDDDHEEEHEDDHDKKKEKEKDKDKDKKETDEEKKLRKEKEKEKEKKEKELKEAAKKKEKEDKKKEKEKEEAAKKKDKEDKKKAKKGDLSISTADDGKHDEEAAILSPTTDSAPDSHHKSHGHSVETISIKNAVAEIATDYKKRKHVFRLVTEAKAEYLFEAPDEKELKAWIGAINAFSKMQDDSPLSPRHADDPHGQKKTLFGKIMGKTDKKVKSKKIFGVDLHDQPMADDLGVPLFVDKCFSLIEVTGLQSMGVYRLSGNAGVISELKEKIDQDINKVNFGNPNTYDADINVVTGLLKSYFRDLPDPLMTFHYYDSFIAAQKIESYDDRMYAIQHVISLLPELNYRTLKYLVEHLARIAQYEEVNKMGPQNLAIVFGPNILRSKDENALSMLTDMNVQCAIVEALILQPVWMFSAERASS